MKCSLWQLEREKKDATEEILSLRDSIERALERQVQMEESARSLNRELELLKSHKATLEAKAEEPVVSHVRMASVACHEASSHIYPCSCWWQEVHPEVTLLRERSTHLENENNRLQDWAQNLFDEVRQMGCIVEWIQRGGRGRYREMS